MEVVGWLDVEDVDGFDVDGEIVVGWLVAEVVGEFEVDADVGELVLEVGDVVEVVGVFEVDDVVEVVGEFEVDDVVDVDGEFEVDDNVGSEIIVTVDTTGAANNLENAARQVKEDFEQQGFTVQAESNKGTHVQLT